MIRTQPEQDEMLEGESEDQTCWNVTECKSVPNSSKLASDDQMRNKQRSRENNGDLDDGVTTLKSQTAHTTDLSSVTSHLPEALLSPDDTPGVFLQFRHSTNWERGERSHRRRVVNREMRSK